MKNKNPKINFLNRLKDIDRADMAHFLRAFLYFFSAFGVILLIMKGMFGLLIAMIVSIPLSILVCSVAALAGASTARIFYGGNKPKWNIQDRLQGDLDQVMYFKRQGQYQKAMQKVNQMLEQEPGFTEALFLKAQILWEGYDTASGANRYLDMAKKSAPTGHLHRWILSYQESVNNRLKKQNYSGAGSSRV